jgi:ABC-2 type transport system ATP-binding protein
MTEIHEGFRIVSQAKKDEGAGMKPENAIEVHDLVRKFGSFTAVDHVSFHVGQGEVFGFLGPNGAGKTTVIRILTGILEPTSGACRVLGFEVPRDTRKLKHSVGYMSQKFSLYEELNVRENLKFFGTVYGIRAAELPAAMDDIIARYELARFGEAQAKELPSGGRQRLALACALVHNPGVLFLDEPTSGMDPSSRRQFWEQVRRLATAGKTVLVTTHYLDEAEYCNRLCLINQGKVIAEGTPAHVRSLARAAALNVACAPLGKGLVALLGQPGLGETAIFGSSLRVVTSDPESARKAIPGLLSEAGVRLDSISDDSPTLEDVFVQLVRSSSD